MVWRPSAHPTPTLWARGDESTATATVAGWCIFFLHAQSVEQEARYIGAYGILLAVGVEDFFKLGRCPDLKQDFLSIRIPNFQAYLHRVGLGLSFCVSHFGGVCGLGCLRRAKGIGDGRTSCRTLELLRSAVLQVRLLAYIAALRFAGICLRDSSLGPTSKYGGRWWW